MSESKQKTESPFPSIEEFLFNAPLYGKYSIVSNAKEVRRMFSDRFRIDGWCMYCKRHATFQRLGTLDLKLGGDIEAEPDKTFVRAMIDIACARNDGHAYKFYLLGFRGEIWKIGQSPSLADIANDESKTYAKVLSVPDRNEFHKAIGLAAHGVGIGSFVYLRRIFERLIQGRFEEFKDDEGWDAKDFRDCRMVEKIAMIKSHLPDFLVENKNIYAVLSKGIHDLSEDECLGYFDILKMSIVEILEEDKRAMEKRARQKGLEKALGQITPGGATKAEKSPHGGKQQTE